MKKVKCSDLDENGCDFEASGEDLEEIRTQIYNHAMSNHVDILLTMTKQKLEELNNKIETLVSKQK